MSRMYVYSPQAEEAEMTEVELEIHKGPCGLEIAAALFGQKHANTNFSPQRIYPKAVFEAGTNPERTSSFHVTVREVKALDEWGVEFEITGTALVWNDAPIGHGGPSTDEKSFPVTVHYNLKTSKGSLRFKRRK